MSKKNTTPKAAATAADAVYEWLGAQPGSHGLEAIVEAVPHTPATVKTALAKLVEAGQIRVIDGDDGVQAWTADADTYAEGIDDPGKAVSNDDGTDADFAGDGDSVTGSEDQTRKAPPVQTDLRVFGIAHLLTQAGPDGLTVADLAAPSGQSVEALWPLLIAMHTAGAAACSSQYLLDPEATWHAAGADPASVNTAQIPAAVECPLCGSANPVPGQAKKKAAPRRSRGDGQPVGTAGRTWGPGELTAEVKKWISDHPDADITPGQITRDIGGNSSGAVRNVLENMTGRGELARVPDTTPATWIRTTQ